MELIEVSNITIYSPEKAAMRSDGTRQDGIKYDTRTQEAVKKIMVCLTHIYCEIHLETEDKKAIVKTYVGVPFVFWKNNL